MLVVVSSPSGGGKGTLIDRVLKTVPGVSYSVSYTTRAPRGAEQDGREYFFVTTAVFEDMIRRGEFLEWADVYGYLYGTSRALLRKRLVARGTDSPADLERRLRGAPSEVGQYKHFQYVILNDDINRASAQLASVIDAERARRERQEARLKETLADFACAPGR